MALFVQAVKGRKNRTDFCLNPLCGFPLDSLPKKRRGGIKGERRSLSPGTKTILENGGTARCAPYLEFNGQPKKKQEKSKKRKRGKENETDD